MVPTTQGGFIWSRARENESRGASKVVEKTTFRQIAIQCNVRNEAQYVIPATEGVKRRSFNDFVG